MFDWFKINEEDGAIALRAKALGLAIEAHGFDAKKEDIITTALTFEAYLRGMSKAEVSITYNKVKTNEN